MNAFIISIRKTRKYLTYPFIMTGIFAVLCSVTAVNINYPVLVFAFCAPAFIGYYFCKNSKKGIACGVCAVCADLVLYSMTGKYFSLIFVLLLSAFSVYVFRRLNIIWGYASLLTVFVLLAAALGSLSGVFTEANKAVAGFLGGKGFLFGPLSALSELFVSDELSGLIYFSSYSKSMLIDGAVVSGVKNIYPLVSDSSVAEYLTGKYFVSVFLSIGLFFAIAHRLHSEERTGFVILTLCAVITGDIRLLSLFLVLYNPLIYIIYLVAVSASYFIAQLLDIRIGFADSAGISELIMNIDKPVYFILTGAVLAVSIYFASRLVIAKEDFGADVYYPKNARAVIDALGGGENIEYIKGEKVIVRNPNIINILALDCDIKANTVTLYKDDFDLIRPYFV